MRRTDSFDCIRKAIKEQKESKEEEIPKLFKEILVSENEGFRFYQNDMCMQFLNSINKYDSNGYTLPRIKAVLIAEAKDDGHRSYIAFTMDGKPYMEWNDSWDFEFKTTLLRMRVKDECDIRNMAKKVKK